MNDLTILMYHRVCPHSRHTEPYFTRGSAVLPEVFRAQIKWLADNCECVTLSDWLSRKGPGMASERPSVALTFDDGYADANTVVAPILSDFGIPWTLFPIARFHAESAQVAWVDHYYALLANAKVSAPDLRTVAVSLPKRPPTITDNLTWWVKGPVKQVLFGLNDIARHQALHNFAKLVDVDLDMSALSAELYCHRDRLRDLSQHGVAIGGHSASHPRLTDIEVLALTTELDETTDMLDEIDVPIEMRVFAYPDGAHNAMIRDTVIAAGFSAALTVEAGVATDSTDRWALPRHIVRNLAPSNPKWCAGLAGKCTQE